MINLRNIDRKIRLLGAKGEVLRLEDDLRLAESASPGYSEETIKHKKARLNDATWRVVTLTRAGETGGGVEKLRA